MRIYHNHSVMAWIAKKSSLTETREKCYHKDPGKKNDTNADINNYRGNEKQVYGTSSGRHSALQRLSHVRHNEILIIQTSVFE